MSPHPSSTHKIGEMVHRGQCKVTFTIADEPLLSRGANQSRSEVLRQQFSQRSCFDSFLRSSSCPNPRPRVVWQGLETFWVVTTGWQRVCYHHLGNKSQGCYWLSQNHLAVPSSQQRIIWLKSPVVLKFINPVQRLMGPDGQWQMWSWLWTVGVRRKVGAVIQQCGPSDDRFSNCWKEEKSLGF